MNIEEYLIVDYRMQQELEEERMERTLEVLQKVKISIEIAEIFSRPGKDYVAHKSDLDFLAAELGLEKQWKRLTTGAD